MTAEGAPAQSANSHNWLSRMEKISTMLSRVLYWIAGAGLIGMLLLIVADIIGIKLLAHPIPGGIEVTAFLGVVVIGFAISYVQVLHGHIQVDFFTSKLQPRSKAIIDSIMTFLGIVFFFVLTWQTWNYAGILHGLERSP